MIFSSLLAFALASAPSALAATKGGTFEEVGDTLVSAMMVFLGNEGKVYILDKAEGNPTQVNGHPAWAAVWDVETRKATPMDVQTNPFCAAGMHLPNGSFATFGGNGATSPGGEIGSVKYDGGYAASYDETYKDYDGRTSIRIITPCEGDITSPECLWYDGNDGPKMQKQRWYPGAESLPDGSVVLIGGFVSGGYINRNTPNVNPAGDGSEPTYEFYPSRGDAKVMDFMVKTSGLNAYALTYLMPSGKMLVQANYSTILWDYENNVETPLPDMPGKVIRVYPASGANAMLPLTPKNNYNPTVLFCGGSDMPDSAWGNYSWPMINTFDYPASADCQRLTAEPLDGSAPAYEQDDDMLETRTMGQFVALPDGTMLVLNGGNNGTAGYSTATGQTATYGEMPWGMSLASGPAGRPALYNPDAPKGSRWSNAGFASSKIARLYHSSAILLADGSVFVAGSNPNVDVNTSTIFPTTYKAEIFYPSYFDAPTRPKPTGMPKTLSYGGDSFDLTIPASSYSGSGNDAAANTSVWLIRGGFTTHALNMGQRSLQLNNTYTVQDDGSISLHVAQVPPNPNLITPGPILMFVTINGIPSNGTQVIVGNGKIGTQPTSAASVLPASIKSDKAKGSGSQKTTSTSQDSGAASLQSSAILGALMAIVAAVSMIGF